MLSILRLFTPRLPTANAWRSVMLYSTIKKKKPISAIERFRRSTNHPENEKNILQLLNTNDTNEISRYLKSVTSITISDSINFNKITQQLSQKNLIHKVIVPDEVIRVKYESKDILVLSNGTIIGWDFNEAQLIDLLPLFNGSISEKYEFESDEFDYIEIDELPQNPKNNGNSYMVNDIIVIQNESRTKKLYDKIAFSIGISRSTRLSILENSLEDFLKITKQNSKNLANGLKITTNEKDIIKATGKLFLLRGKLNLYNELIDTPDLYWSEPTLEKIYQLISTSLDINSRISILNRKLDYATEEQRVFLSLVNEKKSTTLEWTIIILITVEVIFELYKFIFE